MDFGVLRIWFGKWRLYFSAAFGHFHSWNVEFKRKWEIWSSSMRETCWPSSILRGDARSLWPNIRFELLPHFKTSFFFYVMNLSIILSTCFSLLYFCNLVHTTSVTCLSVLKQGFLLCCTNWCLSLSSIEDLWMLDALQIAKKISRGKFMICNIRRNK